MEEEATKGMTIERLLLLRIHNFRMRRSRIMEVWSRTSFEVRGSEWDLTSPVWPGPLTPSTSKNLLYQTYGRQRSRLTASTRSYFTFL